MDYPFNRPEVIGPLSTLSTAFFARSPSTVARDLLGTIIVSVVDGTLAGGSIVETEAYLGRDDPGSHAATRGITKRNAVMYDPPGSVYVYFTYGNHHMLNLVCEQEGVAGAVLLRAVEPTWGIEVMTSRRHGRPLGELCNGPGKLAAALGIDLSDNGTLIGDGRLALYEGSSVASSDIGVSGRIGLSAGHELDLRYYVKNSAFVSRGRLGPANKRREGVDQRGRAE